ncbi:MAG: hypothetical protein ACREBE_12840 [bacterium]
MAPMYSLKERRPSADGALSIYPSRSRSTRRDGLGAIVMDGLDPALQIHRHDGRAIWRAYVNRELTPTSCHHRHHRHHRRGPMAPGPIADARSAPIPEQREDA